MAQQVTADAALAAALKNWYSGKKIQNLLWRNSPVLRAMQKNMVGGQTYNFVAPYGIGGATSGDYTVAIANAANGQVKNAQFAVPPGKLFSVFNINQLERLASETEKGAFIKLAAEKMFAMNEATRKQAAASLYATGYGEFGTVPTGGVASAATTVTLADDAIVKVDVGTTFDVTTTTSPSGTLDSTGPFTISAIDGNTVTFSPAVGTAWVAGAWMEYHGGRDGSGNPNYPTGLAGWLPYDKTGLSTSFYGVNRSLNTGRLSGWAQSYDSSATYPYSATITDAVKLVRRAGGIPKWIVLNDDDYSTVLNEIVKMTNMWQSIDVAHPTGPQAAYGLQNIKYAFSSSYVEEVYDDPYCPKGTFYVLDPDVIEFAGLSNTEKPLNDGITDNNPGSPEVTGEDPTNNPYQFLIDNYLSVQPAADDANGPAARVTLSMYGNFAIHAPAHCAVGVFA